MTADQNERLERIERLLTDLHAKLDDQAKIVQGWKTFWLIVLIHIALSCLALMLESWLDGIPIWGWFAGALGTLATWHGLSLRPVSQRWLRSFLATFTTLLVSLVWFYDAEWEDLFEFATPWVVLFGGGCLVSARSLRTIFGFGLAAPDGPRVAVQGLTLSRLFFISGMIAAMLAVCRGVAWWVGVDGDSLESSYAFPIAIYGSIVACLFSVAVYVGSRKSRLLSRLLIAGEVVIICFVLNLAFLNTFSLIFDSDFEGVWTLQALLQIIPALTAFCVPQLISPLVTTWFLVYSGHHLEFANGREPSETSSRASAAHDQPLIHGQTEPDSDTNSKVG